MGFSLRKIFGPGKDEGNADTSLEERSFAAGEGTVPGSVVGGSSIVGEKDDERVVELSG